MRLQPNSEWLSTIDKKTFNFRYYSFPWLCRASYIHNAMSHRPRYIQPINSQLTTNSNRFWCFALWRHIVSRIRCLADSPSVLETAKRIKHSKTCQRVWQYLNEQHTKKLTNKLWKWKSNGWWVLLNEGLSTLESLCFVLV